jgi:hypothetical protein
MRKSFYLAAAVVAGTVAVPAAAQMTTINFDSGAPLSSYATSDGIVFSHQFVLTDDTFGGAVIVPSDPFYVSLNSSPGVITFRDPTTGAATTSDGFGFTIAGLNLGGGFFSGATLNFLDAAGVSLGTQTFAAIGPNEFRSPFTYLDGFQNISSIVFTRNENTAGSGLFPFDDVRFDLDAAAAVPEPATWAMFLMGFGAVGYSMRSRKVGYRAVQAV